jgi:type II restriction enzyme
MKTDLGIALKNVSDYKSPSQKIRVLTESWVNSQAYCPSCGLNIQKYENNKPVADFFCQDCKEDFELKSKKDRLGNKILDGAYQTALKRLRSDTNPNFFLLNYNPHNLTVINFFIIPKYFFVPDMLEPRKPLSQNARRAGWIGCNIIFKNIPETGKIFYIKNREVEKKQAVLRNWKKTLFLRDEPVVASKGWILDIMSCIDKLAKREFSIDEAYSFEKDLGEKHPNNRHIKDKIRQQMQFLRDKGYLEFVGRGKYKLI